jgi:hypothetical protein
LLNPRLVRLANCLHGLLRTKALKQPNQKGDVTMITLPFFVKRYRKPANDVDDTLYMRIDFSPMTMSELAGTNCTDCRWCTPLLGEYYMVHDNVWKAAGMEPEGGCLCIGCLEERLNRMLTPDDFMDCKLNDPNKPQGQQSPSQEAYSHGHVKLTTAEGWRAYCSGAGGYWLAEVLKFRNFCR